LFKGWQAASFIKKKLQDIFKPDTLRIIFTNANEHRTTMIISIPTSFIKKKLQDIFKPDTLRIISTNANEHRTTMIISIPLHCSGIFISDALANHYTKIRFCLLVHTREKYR
jgi:stress-induced morphogen